MDLAFTSFLTFAALAFEAYAGYPQFLYRSIGHPVTWIGALISWLDRRLNKEAENEAARRQAGAIALGVTLAVAIGASLLIMLVLPAGLSGTLLTVILASTLLAQKSLYQHVEAVADALENGGLGPGRVTVARIVGRDPVSLDEAGVARAAIESLAENFSDGVVAPAFYLALFGLPGGAAYKAANTADSMIGHRTALYEAFGFAAARFDDIVNLPASRLSALWLSLAAFAVPGASPREAIRIAVRDAKHHRSPNAGWPEAAIAGALGLRLAGPRVYGGVMVEDAYMGEGRRSATETDIRQALRLYRVACAIQIVVYACLAAALIAPA
ncbi:MAG: cobalamin biosynthesis protein CobD [Hyphomicrobiales bacterium]|nr:cobalamin biosynthesis protein CobD [Hyphomicrobiales bacterium]